MSEYEYDGGAMESPNARTKTAYGGEGFANDYRCTLCKYIFASALAGWSACVCRNCGAMIDHIKKTNKMWVDIFTE